MGSGAQIALYSMTTSPNSNIFSHIKMSVWVCITYLLDTYGTVCSGKTCITEPFNPSSVTLRWPFPFLLSSVCIALSVCLRVCICVCPYISLTSHFHHPSRFWLKCLQYRVATPQTAPVTQSNRFYRSNQKVLKLRISSRLLKMGIDLIIYFTHRDLIFLTIHLSVWCMTPFLSTPAGPSVRFMFGLNCKHIRFCLDNSAVAAFSFLKLEQAVNKTG